MYRSLGAPTTPAAAGAGERRRWRRPRHPKRLAACCPRSMMAVDAAATGDSSPSLDSLVQGRHQEHQQPPSANADEALFELILARQARSNSPFPDDSFAGSLSTQKERSPASNRKVIGSLYAATMESAVEQAALVGTLQEAEAHEADLADALHRTQLKLVAMEQCLESRDEELRVARLRLSRLEQSRQSSSRCRPVLGAELAPAAAEASNTADTSMQKHDLSDGEPSRPADERPSTDSRQAAIRARMRQLEEELKVDARPEAQETRSADSSDTRHTNGTATCNVPPLLCASHAPTLPTHSPAPSFAPSPAHSPPPSHSPSPALAQSPALVAQALLFAERVLAQEIEDSRRLSSAAHARSSHAGIASELERAELQQQFGRNGSPLRAPPPRMLFPDLSCDVSPNESQSWPGSYGAMQHAWQGVLNMPSAASAASAGTLSPPPPPIPSPPPQRAHKKAGGAEALSTPSSLPALHSVRAPLSMGAAAAPAPPPRLNGRPLTSHASAPPSHHTPPTHWRHNSSAHQGSDGRARQSVLGSAGGDGDASGHEGSRRRREEGREESAGFPERPASVERPQSRIARAGAARRLAELAREETRGKAKDEAAVAANTGALLPHQQAQTPSRDALPPPPSAQRAPTPPALPQMRVSSGSAGNGVSSDADRFVRL